MIEDNRLSAPAAPGDRSGNHPDAEVTRRSVRAFGRRPRRLALAVGAFAGLILVSAALPPPRPRIVWNVSASAPIGLYAIGGRDGIAAGDMVAARVPGRWRQLAGERHYIPVNVPLVKRAAAVAGDTVCAVGESIFVGGRLVASRRAVDGRGRPMPRWTGCVTLRDDALFLLMDAPDSFDGRYFGPTGRDDVIGEATLLWAR